MNEQEPTIPSAPLPTIAHWINLVAIPTAFITVVLTVANVHSPIRVILAVLLFLFGTGSGITQFMRISEPALQLGMVMALSLAIDLLVGQSLLSVHNLNDAAGACILAGITCIRPLFQPGAKVKDAEI